MAINATARARLLALLFGGMCIGGTAMAASSSSQTATVADFVTGGSQTALLQGLVTTTGAQTAATIGSTVGSIVGASSAGVDQGLAGVSRFTLPGQGTGAAAAPGGLKWNGWVALSHNNIAYNFQPLQSSGHADVGLLGIDYTFANNVVGGVAIGFDRTDVDLSFTAGKLKGHGWTIAPYIGVPLTKNLSFDGSLGIGRTNLDMNMGSLGNNLAGSTNDDRTTVTLGLSYRQLVDRWFLTGRAAYLNVDDRIAAYTLTNGAVNVASPSSSPKVEQGRFGGEAAYNAGMVVPYVGLTYIYDFKKPDTVTVNGMTSASDRDSFLAAVGLRFRSAGSLYGAVQLSTEQGRSQIKNDQILFNLGVRF